MPFDINTIPKIRLKEISKGNVSIEKKYNRWYLLYLNNKQQMGLDFFTNREVKELYSTYDIGYGKILISGLGFGIVALWLASKPEVEHIHIVEISQDVVDIFLEKNTLPDNVTIEIADMNSYKTDKQYDCVLLDHYELISANEQLINMQSIAKNIPNHKIFWSWAMEFVYLDFAIKENFQELLDSNKDMSQEWEFFKSNVLAIPTVPILTPEKINEYIYTFYDLLDSPYAKINK
jgi:hypothetical protein